MSFCFELKLTMPQIQLLIAFIKLANKENPGKMPKGTSISSTRALLSEGLLEANKKERCEGTEWKVTRKGYMVANLIKEEVKLVEKLPKFSKPNFIHWYDLPEELTDQTGIGGSKPSGKVIVTETKEVL